MAARFAVGALVAAALIGGIASGAEAAAVSRCVEFDPAGFCLEWSKQAPVAPSRRGGQPAKVRCYWARTNIDVSSDPAIWFDFDLPRPPEGVEVVWQGWECSDGSVPRHDLRWVIPSTPENLGALSRGVLAGTLPEPVVESSPPPGTPSIVGVPVFVAVANWTGVVTESECAAGLCVTVTASPSLVFMPGEPGAEARSCAGSGSRYSPGAGSAAAQAAEPGACAHAYRLRTGEQGRPSEWPGEVSVTWTITWTATSGASGSLPPVTRSTAAPRAVSEVQTVVAGGSTP
jgi:hypothetical protein